MRMVRLASLTLLAAIAAAPAFASTLPWIEDDYPQALNAARARRVPLFVEAWAPW
jgi:hypothetical protein